MRHPLALKFLLLLCLAPVWAQTAHDSVPRTSRPKPRPVVQTPAQPAPQPSTIFCVFGDTQPDRKPERLLITSAVARGMAAERPAFVIGTGDYIDGADNAAGARGQYQRFFQALLPLQKFGPVPLAAAAGNHDTGGGLGGLFEQYFGRRYYSFDVSCAHFIILDTQQPGQYGRIDGVQWQWLYQDLTQAQDKPLIFVALHQPLFPVSVHRGSSQDRYPKYRDRLHMLFARAKVNAVFAGHEHLYNHQVRDKVHYFINGGGGGPLYANAGSGGFYHYLKVQYNEDGYAVEVKQVQP